MGLPAVRHYLKTRNADWKRPNSVRPELVEGLEFPFILRQAQDERVMNGQFEHLSRDFEIDS
jgi:hypothetical protein